MVELSQVEEHAYAAHGKHEDEEDRFFCWAGHVTLHLLHTGVAVTLKHPWHVEAVQEVLAGQEADLQGIAEHHLDDVEAGDAFLTPHFGVFVRSRKPPRSVGDLFDVHVVILLAALRMHQDAVDVARMKLATVVVMTVATMVSVTVVIHVMVQEGVAAVTCLCRLVN